MRHFLANIVTYSIATLLVVGAAAFAWMRSSKLVLTDEAAVMAAYEPARTTGFRWEELGRDSYVRNCASCHGREGRGWDEYPGIRHTGRLFDASGGRGYVVDLHLYGLASRRWGAPMPPMGHLHDVELAAVINHVLTAHSDAPGAPARRLLLPGEVAARRGRSLSPADVNRSRPLGDSIRGR